MLLGRGDGRERLYERFCEYHLDKNPKVTQAELMVGYYEYGRVMDAKLAAEPQRLARDNLLALVDVAAQKLMDVCYSLKTWWAKHD
jgi:hypothetical protein